MSDSENIVLKLGTIIKIIASSNEELHENMFMINYLDDKIVELIGPNIDEPLILNTEKNGYFRDKSIESIEILSYPEEDGYALQNDLTVNKWISIRFGGDLPTTINGQITNLENDMIQITIYPSGDIIYINFDYKGIPRDLPIISFDEIKEPTSMEKSVSKVAEEEDDKEEETFEETDDIDFEEEQMRAPDEEIQNILDHNIKLGDELVFLEDMGKIEEMVNVSESEKRFSLIEQKNDLLDSLLADVPTLERTRKIMDYFNKNVQRFDELRMMFSVFDNYNNIVGFKKNDKQVKSIIEYLINFNKDFKWIIPVVRNKKKIYNVDIEEDDLDILNIISEYKDSHVLSTYLKYVSDYNKNEVPEGYNKYYYFISKICELFSPFELTNDKSNILKEEFVKENFDVLLENLNNFESYTVKGKKQGKDEIYNINNFKFLIQRYTKGLTKLFLPDKFTKNFIIEPLTTNDKMSLKGLLILPYAFVRYAKINLHKTSILERVNLNFIKYNIGDILTQEINNKIITDENEYEEDEDFLTEPLYYTSQSITNFDDQEPDFYKNFLNKFIPSNRELFNLIKTQIHNKNNYYEIVKALEPFGIYENNIGFMLYRTIVLFMEENNLEIKKQINTNTQIFSNYLSNISKIDSINGIFKVLENTDLFEVNHYRKYSNFNIETLNNMFLVDNGQFLYSLISKENLDLQNNINVDDIIDESLDESKKSNACDQKYILAKRYAAIEDLQEDDSETIYFDKKYDDTPYDIGKHWLETNDFVDMGREEIITELANHLIKNNGIEEIKATRDATSMIFEKKEVIDGDIAILDEIDQELKYYIRKNQKWNLLDEFSGRMIDSINFCNLKENCVKIRNNCMAEDETKNQIQSRLNKEINKHFENVIGSSFEELNTLVQNNYTQSSSYLNKCYQLIKDKNFLKNYNYNEIASTLENNEIIVSPLTELRDIILSQNDFINKHNYIIKFVDKFCRLKLDFNTDENDYWYYCIATGLPLLPTYFYRLARIVMKDINQFKNDYIIEIDRIVSERGAKSADGDKWVDKYSGYIIKYIDSSNDEGYTEDGYKIVSRDLIIEDEGVQFLNKLQIIDSQFKSPIAKQIMGIIDTLNKNIGITLKNDYNILIIKNVTTQLKMLQKREDYDLYILRLAQKEKKGKPYEKYFNEALMYSILSYYSLAIQISIPHITEGKPFKGCSESFLGFPISDNGDTTLIDYIICVSQKLKSSVAPWNVLPTSKKPAKMEKMKSFMKEKIINILTNFALKNDEILQLLEEKRTYLMETFSFDTVDTQSLTSWYTFLPAIYNFDPYAVRNLPAGFETNLYNDFITGNFLQFNKLLSLYAKIRSYSFTIQKSIRNIVEKQQLMLESYKDNTVVPYLENSCCLTTDTSNYQYMIQSDTTIAINNSIVIAMETIVNNVTHLTRAPKMISYENTKFLYPILENIYSEEVIYSAFIHHCKLDVMDFPRPELAEFCLEKANGKSIKMKNTLSLKEKIEFLKEEGVTYSNGDLLQLLDLVNRQNIIHINLNPAVLSSRQEFENLLDLILEADAYPCNQDIIGLFKDITNSYSVEDETKYGFQVSNIIRRKNDELLTEIIDFFQLYKIEVLKNKRKNNVLHFLQNYLDFKEIGENIFCSKADETGFKIGNIIKENIKKILKIFPSIIMNQTNYENKIPPNHWNLENKHKLIVSSNIAAEYGNFNDFFGREDVNILLSNVIEQSEILLKFSETIPIFMKIENDTILNGNIYKGLLYNIFLCSIKLYITLCNTLETFTNIDDTEELMLLDERVRNEKLRGKKQQRNIKILEMLKTFLLLFYNQKENILNYSNDDIKYMILKAKEKEKEKIKSTLKNMTIEEREVEDYKKQHKLGKWNKGQTSGIFKYDQKTFANELEDLLGDLSDEIEIGMNDEVTEMRRQIFGVSMQEVEDDYNLREEQEIYSLAGLWDDDDTGEADGDEYF